MVALRGRGSRTTLGLCLELLGDVGDVVLVPVGILQIDRGSSIGLGLHGECIEASLVNAKLCSIAPHIVRHSYGGGCAAIVGILHIPCGDVVVLVGLDEERGGPARGGVICRLGCREALAQIRCAECANHHRATERREILGLSGIFHRDSDFTRQADAVIHLEYAGCRPFSILGGHCRELVIAESHLVGDFHSGCEREVGDRDRIDAVERSRERRDRVRRECRAAIVGDREPILRHARIGGEAHRVVGALDRCSGIRHGRNGHRTRGLELRGEGLALDRLGIAVDILGAEDDGVCSRIDSGRGNTHLGSIGDEAVVEARGEVAILEYALGCVAREVVASHHACRRASLAVDRGAHESHARSRAGFIYHGLSDREHRAGIAEREFNICTRPADICIYRGGRAGFAGRRKAHIARLECTGLWLAEHFPEDGAHPVGACHRPCCNRYCRSAAEGLHRDSALVGRVEREIYGGHRDESLETVRGDIRKRVARLAPEVPARLVGASAGEGELFHAEHGACRGLDEFATVVECAEVAQAARAEVVKRDAVGDCVGDG